MPPPNSKKYLPLDFFLVLIPKHLKQFSELFSFIYIMVQFTSWINVVMISCVFLKKHYVASVFSEINSLENTCEVQFGFLLFKALLRKAALLLSLSVTASLVTETQHIGQYLTLTSTHYKELLKSVRKVMITISVAVEGPSTNNMCMPATVIQTAPQLYLFGPFFSSL